MSRGRAASAGRAEERSCNSGKKTNPFYTFLPKLSENAWNLKSFVVFSREMCYNIDVNFVKTQNRKKKGMLKMTMTKKITAALAATAMLLSAASCGSTTDEQTTTTANPAVQPADAPEGGYRIGAIQMMTHVALDKAYDGFVQYFADQGYVNGDNITITYQNGQGETANLSTIADQYIGDNVDLIFAIATPSAQAAAGKTTEIPIIGTAITDFAEAGLVDSNENPGTNVSGTNDMNPIEQQIDLMLELCPDVKTVGFLYNSSEDNSILQTNIAKAYLETLGIAWTERTVSGTNDVQQATASIVTECDALYLPTDNVFASSMTIVSEIANDAKIPTICGESGMVEGGGLGTLGINYFNIGYQAGEMALRVLQGADISTMPVESSTNYDYCFNGDTAAAIGLSIPDKYADYVISGTSAE